MCIGIHGTLNGSNNQTYAAYKPAIASAAVAMTFDENVTLDVSHCTIPCGSDGANDVDCVQDSLRLNPTERALTMLPQHMPVTRPNYYSKLRQQEALLREERTKFNNRRAKNCAPARGRQPRTAYSLSPPALHGTLPGAGNISNNRIVAVTEEGGMGLEYAMVHQ